MNTRVRTYQKAVNARKGNLGPSKGPTGVFGPSKQIKMSKDPLSQTPLFAVPTGKGTTMLAYPQSTLEFSVLRKIN